MRIVMIIAIGAGWQAQVKAEGQAFVRGASDFDSIVVRGASAIGADQVRQALRRDWMVQLHGTPTAPLQQFVDTVRQRLGRAYAASGFPQATVQVEHDDEHQRLSVTVKEGPRFHNGTVRVEGLPDDLSRALAAYLTQSTPPRAFKTGRNGEGGVWIIESTPADDDAAKVSWEAGAPTNFEESSHRRISAEVRRCLARSGYFQPTFEVKLLREKDQGVLLVIVKNIGPKAQIVRTSVQGLSRNTQEQVMALLEVAAGDAVDVDQLYEMQTRLWRSGRFLRHTLTLRPMPDDPAKADLQLDLIEAPSVPPLDQDLSETEQALARMAEWATHFHKRDSDLLVQATNAEGEATLIFSPAQGVFASVSEAEPKEGAARLTLTTALMRDGLWWWGGGGKPAARAPINELGFHVSFLILPNLEGDKKIALSLNAGVSTTARKQLSPVMIHVAPAALLAWLHDRTGEREPASRIIDGIMHIQLSETEELALRADRGDFVSFSYADANGNSFKISAGKETFQQRLAELRTDQPVDITAGQALCRVVMALRVLGDEPSADLPEGLIDVLDRAAAPAIDRLLTHAKKGDFSIPAGGEELTASGLAGFIQLAIPFVDYLFVRGEWPWTVTRQTLLTVGGDARYMQSELVRLHDSNMGPLGYVTSASLMSKVNPHMGRALAREGLKRLETDHFLADCRVLLDERTEFGKGVRELLVQLRQLAPAEQKAFDQLHPKLGAALRALSTEPAEDGAEARDALDLALRQVWETSLRQAVETHLNRIIQANVDGRL